MTTLDILYENNDFIVVNKAAGLISEKSTYEDNTVEVQVLNHLLEKKPKPYVGVIHRLDRVTSGVMIFAKNKKTLVEFNARFSQREVQKSYLAIVKTKPPKPQDVLVNFLVKNRLEKRADIVETKSKEAQECNLSYKLLAQNSHGYLIEIKPKTGRFHQIRAQLAHIGLPIIGDEKYGSDQEYLPRSICLHASSLSYFSNDAEKPETFVASMPQNVFWVF